MNWSVLSCLLIAVDVLCLAMSEQNGVTMQLQQQILDWQGQPLTAAIGAKSVVDFSRCPSSTWDGLKRKSSDAVIKCNAEDSADEHTCQ